MESKNTIIALALMLAVWVGFTILFPPAQPPATKETGVESEVAKSAPTPTAAPTPTLSEGEDVSPVSQAVRDQEFVIENDVFQATLTNNGGRIKSLFLKEYMTSPKEGAPVSLVVPGPDRLATLRTVGQDGWDLPPDTLYAVSVKEPVLRLAAGETREVVFSLRLPSGLVVEKIYEFRGGDHYDFHIRLRLRNTGDSPRGGNLSLSLVRPWDEAQKGGQFEFVGPATFAGGKMHHDDIDDLGEKPKAYGTDAVWTGFVDKYFISALVPLAGAGETVRIEKSDSAIENQVLTPFVSLASGESVNFAFMAYYGPKDLDILKAVDHQLAEAVDFGFFSPLARPLLHVLKFFYSFLGNYGLSIILLTAIIKLLFWPLTHKSYASMKAMQKLQPEMQKVREKYGKDKEKLNREIMELYKKHRVNPLGGCLPMLVQIPVFFALYKTLMEAIELRHAPFFLWITDLSAKDPYYITPLIMGASMFIQQKMTPTTMDPTQAKIFMLMPVIFTVMFLNFPSGLVIYWLVNNILTIGQQAWINRKK